MTVVELVEADSAEAAIERLRRRLRAAGLELYEHDEYTPGCYRVRGLIELASTLYCDSAGVGRSDQFDPFLARGFCYDCF
jgi:hypothetical protein